MKHLAPVLLALALAAPANAATFTLTPPAHATSGPSTFAFQSQGTGDYSGVAYKLPGEPYWHRCLTSPQQITIPSLPVGTYSLDISDDVNVSSAASHGQLYSGWVQACSQTPPPDPSMLNFARYTFTIDPAASALTPTPSSTPTAGPSASSPVMPVAVVQPAPVVQVDCHAERTLLEKLKILNVKTRRAFQHRRTSSRHRAWQRSSRAYIVQRRLVSRSC